MTMNQKESKDFSDLQRQVSSMEKKMAEVHAFVFGMEGQGGLSRLVERMEKEVKTLSGFRSKVAGIAAGIAILGGALGSKLSKLIFGP